MAVTGHKIFWNTAPQVDGLTTTVHPGNTAYNSPIDITTLPGFDIGNPTQITLPSDFWHNNFASTGLYLRIGAFDGAELVSLSKRQDILHFGLAYTGTGTYTPMSLPLDGGETRTLLQIGSAKGSPGVFYINGSGAWVFIASGTTPDPTPIMAHNMGAIFIKPPGVGVFEFVGRPWRKEQ
jgi:hypothetical protein